MSVEEKIYRVVEKSSKYVEMKVLHSGIFIDNGCSQITHIPDESILLTLNRSAWEFNRDLKALCTKHKVFISGEDIPDSCLHEPLHLEEWRKRCLHRDEQQSSDAGQEPARQNP